MPSRALPSWCEELNEEFDSFSPVEGTGEVSNDQRVIVDNTVYDFDRQTLQAKHCTRALAKLSDEEVSALGLTRLANQYGLPV
jgi:hypothetical protein